MSFKEDLAIPNDQVKDETLLGYIYIYIYLMAKSTLKLIPLSVIFILRLFSTTSINQLLHLFPIFLHSQYIFRCGKRVRSAETTL